MESPHSILKKVFGYDSFRPGQEAVSYTHLDVYKRQAQAQPTQKEGAQQKPRHQIRGDSRQTDRFRYTGCQQACNERKRHADEQLLHKIRSS